MAKCAECGFLAARNLETRALEEVELESRQNGSLKKSRYHYLPVCFTLVGNFVEAYKKLCELPEYTLKLNSMHGVEGPKTKDVVKAILSENRECPSFIDWHQGSTPKEHQEMIDRNFMIKIEEKRRENDRKWHWIELAAIILGTGLFTLLGAWIARMH